MPLPVAPECHQPILRSNGDWVTAAWSKGLGAVVNSQGIMQSPSCANTPASRNQVSMICVAMGYPDHNFPANPVVSQRKAVNEVASFVGFD
jgi:hypothetical protein